MRLPTSFTHNIVHRVQASADQRRVLTVARAQRRLRFDLWLFTEEEALSSPTMAGSSVINSPQPQPFSSFTLPSRAYSHVLSSV